MTPANDTKLKCSCPSGEFAGMHRTVLCVTYGASVSAVCRKSLQIPEIVG